MRHFWVVLSVALVSTCTVWAEPQCPSFTFNAGAGWREDNLNWSIAGPGGSPTTLSALKWRELRMYAVGGGVRYVGTHHYVLQFSGECAKIYHGHNRDSDYLFDHKEGEFSRVNSNAGRGHVYDLSGAVGYQVMSTGRRTLVTLLAGYAFDAQYLHMYDGNQVISPIGPPGPIPGLDSRYTTRWLGPWLGIDTSTRVECNASVYAGVSWHFPQFRAHGKWNLRDDLTDGFHQKATAWGYDATLGFTWDFTERWGVGILGKYRMFQTRNGSSKADLLIDGVVVRTHTKLHGVRWSSGSVFLTLFARF